MEHPCPEGGTNTSESGEPVGQKGPTEGGGWGEDSYPGGCLCREGAMLAGHMGLSFLSTCSPR